MAHVASLLIRAKRPLVLLGSQCMLRAAPDAAPLVAALEVLGAPMFLGGMARGLMGREHALHLRQERGKALQEADLVLLAGSVPDFRLQYGRALPKGVPVICINRRCGCDSIVTASLPKSPTLIFSFSSPRALSNACP